MNIELYLNHITGYLTHPDCNLVLKTFYEILSTFCDISFQKYIVKNLSSVLLRQFNLETKANLISSGSKIVKRLRRRQYDPVIIGRVLGPL